MLFRSRGCHDRFFFYHKLIRGTWGLVYLTTTLACTVACAVIRVSRCLWEVLSLTRFRKGDRRTLVIGLGGSAARVRDVS